LKCLKKKTNGVAWLLDEPHTVETTKGRLTDGVA
jgi:hypothetical protein